MVVDGEYYVGFDIIVVLIDGGLVEVIWVDELMSKIMMLVVCVWDEIMMCFDEVVCGEFDLGMKIDV